MPKRRRPRAAPKPGAPPGLQRLIFAAFCLSGFAGLMHQVVWAKLLVGLIGATAHAQAAVLAVFMGGLALGSVVFGRRVDRQGRPLRTYLVLELLIGAYCLLLPLLLLAAESGYVVLATYTFDYVGFTFLLRFSLALALVLFPAVLMGATLPILARHLVERVEATQRQVARLYALNSLGAVLGAGTAGFVTLPLLGLYPSLAIASGLNLAAAALVLGPARREAAAGGRTETSDARRQQQGDERTPPLYTSEQYAVTLVALALSGFAAMGYEVLFTRVIALSFGLSAYSFTVMLMSFITGISLGSAIVSRLRVQRPLWLLGVSQLAVVVALLAVTPLVSRLPYEIALLRIALQDVPLGFELYQIGKASLCLAVLLLPTTCLGFSFPLVAQIQARHADQIGARVGTTYAWNTVGNVLGAVLTGLVLLPGLGLLGAFHVNFTLNFAAGLALLLVAGEVALRRRMVASAVALGAVAVYLVAGSGWLDSLKFSHDHLRLVSGPAPEDNAAVRARHPASSFNAWMWNYLTREATAKHFYFEEDAHTTVLAYDNGGERVLYVNGKPDASTVSDLDTQLLLAHLPMFLHPDARKLLVIGHGSGITAGSALLHPIEQADLVEISRGVLNADALFAEFNYSVLQDSRVRVHVDDAQSFLRAVPRRYDVIISEPSNPWIAGIAGLFTVEFFEQVRDKLDPGGLAVFWFHQYEQSDASVELVLRSIAAVFPQIVLARSADYGDLIAVASMHRLEPDFPAMERRYDDPPIRNDLARIQISNLAGLLSHYALSQQRLHAVLAPGPLNTVGHQRLEYSAPRSFFRDEGALFMQRSDPLLRRESPGDIFLDRYIAYRAAEGDPMRRAELEDVARLYGPRVAPALMERAQRAPEGSGPAIRLARGLVPEAASAGLYEANYWAGRYVEEGKIEAALPFYRRAMELRASVDTGAAGGQRAALRHR